MCTRLSSPLFIDSNNRNECNENALTDRPIHPNVNIGQTPPPPRVGRSPIGRSSSSRSVNFLFLPPPIFIVIIIIIGSSLYSLLEDTSAALKGRFQPIGVVGRVCEAAAQRKPAEPLHVGGRRGRRLPGGAGPTPLETRGGSEWIDRGEGVTRGWGECRPGG